LWTSSRKFRSTTPTGLRRPRCYLARGKFYLTSYSAGALVVIGLWPFLLLLFTNAVERDRMEGC
jgi:hypothetical protein